MPALPKIRLSRTVACAAAAAVLAGSAVALPAAADSSPARNMPSGAASQHATAPTDRIIIKFKASVRGKSAERAKAYGRAAQAAGVPVKELRATAGGANILTAPAGTGADKVDELAAALAAQPNVELAEKDAFVHTAAAPDDPGYPQQWNLHGAAGLNLPGAWDTSTGAGVTVAVVDTGITAHPDLAPNLVPGYDFISEDPDNTFSTAGDGDGRDADPSDPGDACGTEPSSWHGTHVAGIIGAVAGNHEGIAGVAYGAKVQPVRALGACGGYISDIADAIAWAAGATLTGIPVNSTPARVINLSLGGDGSCSSYLQGAVDMATSLGSVVVAAAGNSGGPASNSNPANCNNVVAVGATGPSGSRAGYSNFGPEVDVSAPGGDMSSAGSNGILSTYNNGTVTPGQAEYAYLQGTSMASPHVAGVAALMLSANPGLTPAQVEEKLKASARPLPGICDQGGCGTGLVDAAAAVASVLPGAVPYVASGTPTMSGLAAVGQHMTAVAGTWSPSGAALTYQWRRAGAPITGATASSYAPAAADAGTLLSVTVTGTAAGYKPAAATSEPARVARGTLTGPTPMISGTRKVGYTLTAVPGAWTPGAVLKYQWYRAGVAISGASASKYTLVAADQGKLMRLRVGAIKAGYTTTVKDSPTTSAIAVGTLVSSRPWISGTARYGYTLTANPGTWTAGTAFRYQWYRSGAAISGATGRYYRLAWVDRYDVMSVRVVGSKAGYASVAKYSGYTARVP